MKRISSEFLSWQTYKNNKPFDYSWLRYQKRQGIKSYLQFLKNCVEDTCLQENITNVSKNLITVSAKKLMNLLDV